MKIIWINGSINAGKSTIAAALHSKIRKSVNIELDHLRHFAENDKLESIAEYIIKDALEQAKKWSQRGYLPILTWPLIGDDGIMFEYAEKIGLEPIVVNLVPQKDSIKRNRGGRELTEWEMNRIDYMYENNVHKPKFGTSINNTHQTVDETLAEVMKIISNFVKPYL